MVVMDKTIEKGGENSYEHKMNKVLGDMKEKPLTRRKDGSIEYGTEQRKLAEKEEQSYKK